MPHQCLKCGQLFPEGSTTILRGCPECRGTKFFFTQEALPAEERERLLKNSEISLREAVEMLLRQSKEGVLTPDGVEWAKVNPAQTSPAVKPVATPPSSWLEEVAPAPARPRGESKLLAGNRLLIKMPKGSKRHGGRQEVRWDYLPPPAPRELQVPAAERRVLYIASPAPEPSEVPLVALGPAPSEAVIDQAGPTPAPAAATPPPGVDAIVPASPSPEAAPSSFSGAPPTPVAVLPQDSPASPAIPAPGEAQPETIRIQTPGQYEIDVKRLLEDSPIVIHRDGTYLIHLPSLFESAAKSKK